MSLKTIFVGKERRKKISWRNSVYMIIWHSNSSKEGVWKYFAPKNSGKARKKDPYKENTVVQ